MAGKKGKRRDKRKKKWILPVAVLLALALAVAGYSYRDYIYAAMFKGIAAPGEGELPLTGADEEKPGEPEQSPDPDRPDEDPPPVPKPPPGELLHIADGDYLPALVTRYTTLGDYAPDDLVAVAPEMVHPAQRQWRYFLRQEAYEHLCRMWEAARDDGVELLLTSAYRSYPTQEELFRNYASRHGEDKANTFSARAGQSEHQLGTAVDFGGTASDNTEAFAGTAPGRWLAENAHKYGFAMSYPEGSSEITGYIYEPWHFRYIGVEAAEAWKESGLVLSEFLKERYPQYWVK